MTKNYYAGNVNSRLEDLDNQEMAEFREQACEIEDWRTVDEIDAEMQMRRINKFARLRKRRWQKVVECKS